MMVGISERPARVESEQAEWEDYVHIGPGTLAGRFIRRFWQPVYVAEDLSAGRAKPIRILGEDLTLYRGEDLSPNPSPARGGEPAPPSLAGKGDGGLGQPHLLAFRCAHRGTQLSTGWVEGDNLRCFYHGWTYDGSGQCVEQPAEPEPFCQRIRIRGYPVQEYLGLIWAYLGEGEPPPLQRFPQLDRTDDGVLQVQGGNVVPTSYANNVENDPAHVPFVHREAGHSREIPYVHPQETQYGTRDHQPNVNVLNSLTHRIMPNARLLRAFTAFPREFGWAEQCIWFVPVDDDSHVAFNIVKLHRTPAGIEKWQELRPQRRGSPTEGTRNRMVETAAQVLRGEIDHHTFDRTTPNLVPLQDLISQWGQGSIRNRVGEHLGRSDAGVVLWRQILQRELRALAEGRPLKRWRVPERLELPMAES